jgi:hypothetical protein
MNSIGFSINASTVLHLPSAASELLHLFTIIMIITMLVLAQQNTIIGVSVQLSFGIIVVIFIVILIGCAVFIIKKQKKKNTK